MGLFSAIQRGLQAVQEKAESEAAPLIQLIEDRDLSGGADALCRRLGSLSFTARGVAMQAYRRKFGSPIVMRSIASLKKCMRAIDEEGKQSLSMFLSGLGKNWPRAEIPGFQKRPAATVLKRCIFHDNGARTVFTQEG